jgi:DnaK suppressor protein
VNNKSKEHFKRLLLAKQQEVLAGKNGIALSSRQDGEPQGDAADQATVETEAKVQARLRQTESHLLRAIDEALSRMEQGSFGVCQVCGNPIPQVRLEAVPWTRVCRECKEQKGG